MHWILQAFHQDCCCGPPPAVTPNLFPIYREPLGTIRAVLGRRGPTNTRLHDARGQLQNPKGCRLTSPEALQKAIEDQHFMLMEEAVHTQPALPPQTPAKMQAFDFMQKGPFANSEWSIPKLLRSWGLNLLGQEATPRNIWSSLLFKSQRGPYIRDAGFFWLPSRELQLPLDSQALPKASLKIKGGRKL